jgi:signal transduction histidine kinase
MLEEMGLKSAIPWYLEGFTKRSGIRTSLDMCADFERLPGDLELALFRVLQESLTNVHRHSGSLTADVHLTKDANSVILQVSDEGKGTDSKCCEESGLDWMGGHGVGIRGMAERIRQLGGKLELSSTKEGTTVRAILPIR